jgi:HK97 gp10 family phage protein
MANYIKGDYRVEFEEKVRKRVQTRLKKIGALIKKRAKQLVPVKTGRLKKSIHVEVTPGKVEVIADAPVNGVSGNPSYAYFVETGEGRGSAQPFLRPAIHSQIDEIQRILNS